MKIEEKIYQSLTKTEKIVAKYIAIGYGNGVISQILCISPKTVATHRVHIYQKLSPILRGNERCTKTLISLLYWKNNLEELKKLQIERLYEQ